MLTALLLAFAGLAEARTCAEIEADAKALMDSAATCTDSCEVMTVEPLVGAGSCVAAFQCSVAVSTDMDRADFVIRAHDLSVEKRACGECAIASCVAPQNLKATCVEGHCELEIAHPPRPGRGVVLPRVPATR